MQIEFNMVDLVGALDVVSIVPPRPMTTSGAAGYLFVVRDNRCHVYSRDSACVAMSHFTLLSSDGDGQFVYPAEYINALRLLSSSSDTCVIQATEENEKFMVCYQASSGAKAERSSFDPSILFTCDQDLAEAEVGPDFNAGILREAISQARPYLAKEGNDESHKGLQVLDSTRLEYAKGNGCLFVTDGTRTFYFNSTHFQDKHLEIHGQHLGQLVSFLGKTNKITVKYSKGVTFIVDAKGNAFGWPKHAKSHSKFGYYPLKSDAYVFRIPKARLVNSLAHVKSELDPKEDKIKVNFDPEKKTLCFGVSASTAKVEGIPVLVEVVQAENTPWSFGVNANHMSEIVNGVKGNEIEFRVWVVPSQGERKNDVALFRTIDRFMLDESGKVTTEPEGAFECQVTRYMPSKG